MKNKLYIPYVSFLLFSVNVYAEKTMTFSDLTSLICKMDSIETNTYRSEEGVRYKDGWLSPYFLYFSLSKHFYKFSDVRKASFFQKDNKLKNAYGKISTTQYSINISYFDLPFTADYSTIDRVSGKLVHNKIRHRSTIQVPNRHNKSYSEYASYLNDRYNSEDSNTHFSIMTKTWTCKVDKPKALF